MNCSREMLQNFPSYFWNTKIHVVFLIWATLYLSLDQTRAFMTENNAVEKNGKKIFYLFGTILCQTTMKEEHLCFRIPKLWQSLKRFMRTFQQA